MTAEEMIAYLKTWATLNAQEVYGSPREFVNIDALARELDKIADLKKESY